jgi:hypothetical protein
MGTFTLVLSSRRLLKGQCSCTRFFASGFFHESSSLKPLKITLGLFIIFSKIHRETVCTSQDAPLVSTTMVENLPPVSTTPRQICRRYQLHLWQICRQCQLHRWQVLPPVPLVSLTPVAPDKPESFRYAAL